ncbi:hybrid sensor histidine kinase/response regulator [Variovorax defluvii]
MRERNIATAALAVVTLIFVAISSYISDLDETIVHGTGPVEGYYWTVSQYQLAYLRMREAAEVLALQGNVVDDELSKRSDVLMSKALILTGDSELTAFFESIAGFTAGRSATAAFHHRVNPMLDSPESVRMHASELAKEFAGIEDVVLTLANAVAIEDMKARHTAMESLLTRRRLLWISVWFGFSLMLLWVLSMSLSWSRYLREAKARERALESERQAVRAKTQFLGMVSHELRSPLQSIVSALDVLESRQAWGAQSEVTRRIRRSADELAVQLRDLLTLARGQTGHIELRPEVFDAVELVREITGDAASAAESNGLSMAVNVPQEALFVVADGGRIGQLLHNLVNNAVRYTERGGVTVSLQAFDASSALLHLRIADTGPGLPDAAAATMTQGREPVPHQPGRGRGIGLAVVRALLLQLGGSVEVSRTPGGGTTLALAIPAVAAEERAPTKGSGEDRVLVASDDRELLGKVARMCANLELRGDTAPSAAFALNLLAAHTYGAVLIDLGMPGTTAAELAGRVRTSSLNCSAHLVGMTAARSCAEALAAFDSIWGKPIGAAQITALMQQRKPPAPPR